MVKSASKYHPFFTLLLLLLLTVACGRSDKEQQKVEPDTAVAVTPYSPLEELYELNSGVKESIADWKAYVNLEREMKNFRATRSGDLGFITDELIRIQKGLITDSIPEKLKIPAVKSRALVFGTFTQKLKDQLNHRVPVADIDTTRIKIMESYNAFRYQISDALRDKIYEDFLNRDSLDVDGASIPKD